MANGENKHIANMSFITEIYTTFPDIFATPWRILSWSHYKRLMQVPDNDIARYSVLHDNNRLFASKYMLYMPTEEELKQEIERQKEFFRLQHNTLN